MQHFYEMAGRNSKNSLDAQVCIGAQHSDKLVGCETRYDQKCCDNYIFNENDAVFFSIVVSSLYVEMTFGCCGPTVRGFVVSDVQIDRPDRKSVFQLLFDG